MEKSKLVEIVKIITNVEKLLIVCVTVVLVFVVSSLKSCQVENQKFKTAREQFRIEKEKTTQLAIKKGQCSKLTKETQK